MPDRSAYHAGTTRPVLGHDWVIERFATALRRGRLASTFLFVGPDGVGKRTLAMWLAQGLLCERRHPGEIEPCGFCPSCHQLAAGSHPDLEIVGKPADKNYIPVETFIGDREHRMREGLCHNIGLKPFGGGYKVAIIDDADLLNQEGANCLLKTLEEPPPHSVLFLIGVNELRQLPTIRSRCQVFRFRGLEEATLVQLIRRQGIADSDAAARSLARAADGSLSRAQLLSDQSLAEFRQQFVQRLATVDWNTMALAKEIAAFLDQAGKDGPLRRARLRQVIGTAFDFHRALLRDLIDDGAGRVADGLDAISADAVREARRLWARDPESLTACLDRSLDAQWHVDANANQATLLECWLDDLLCLGTRGYLANR